ncbi:MAG: hypothetical protein AB8B99_06740 [Phormidesmis sp.]
MFQPRRIETSPNWLNSDGIKLYTVSATGDANELFTSVTVREQSD